MDAKQWLLLSEEFRTEADRLNDKYSAAMANNSSLLMSIAIIVGRVGIALAGRPATGDVESEADRLARVERAEASIAKQLSVSMAKNARLHIRISALRVAVNIIGLGTTDLEPPYRCLPPEEMRKIASAALEADIQAERTDAD